MKISKSERGRRRGLLSLLSNMSLRYGNAVLEIKEHVEPSPHANAWSTPAH